MAVNGIYRWLEPLYGRLRSSLRPFQTARMLFLDTTEETITNSNSASAALNKWLHHYVPKGCTMHSFRHSMRDRLRAVECPSEIIDQIGGWAFIDVGKKYGQGYDLTVCKIWFKKIS